MKTIVVFVETDQQKTFNAYAETDLPFGVLGEGDTVAQTIEDFKHNFEEMKSMYLEEGNAFPEVKLVFPIRCRKFFKNTTAAYLICLRWNA